MIVVGTYFLSLMILIIVLSLEFQNKVIKTPNKLNDNVQNTSLERFFSI
jgi:hypothetical protein